ncbi:MAG TPA: TIM barrel protein [Actinophytocola sp.]|uniref:TIM barrel protein n=1 Tax=Actinophytocola sp. TaxID=1872138 RepID=UPI002DBEB160|nr:TIM barrel protein [Actinophytocola sp.]HEU5474107.1 TIM barrel protein [Actinophytocola sp.]
MSSLASESSMRPDLSTAKIAGAPISWGVCEVPGWGRMLDVHTVLGEMAELGLPATELGPPGYLPEQPAELSALLDRYGLRLVGGFLAAVLHDPDQVWSTMDDVADVVELLSAVGGEVLVLAAATGRDSYDVRPQLPDEHWRTLLATACRIRDLAARKGLRTVLHPHAGTHVERKAEVERFLADSDLPLCVDTGHLLIGGTDPVELVRRHPDRVGHVHLKDVRAAIADVVRAGQITYTHAVGTGMYVPLGDGDINLPALIRLLVEAGYDGWYVLEQDTVLPGGSTAGDDRPRRDTARSLAHLNTFLSWSPR